MNLRQALSRLLGRPIWSLEELPGRDSSVYFEHFSGWIFDPRQREITLELWGDQELLQSSQPLITRPDLAEHFQPSPEPKSGFFIPVPRWLFERSPFSEIRLLARVDKKSWTLWQKSKRPDLSAADLRAELFPPANSSADIFAPEAATRAGSLHGTAAGLAPRRGLSAVRDLVLQSQLIFVIQSWERWGGVLSVDQHCRTLRAAGKQAAILILDQSPSTVPLPEYAAQVSREQLPELPWDTQSLVATFWPTARTVADLRDKHPRISSFYYVQGYEPWLYPEGSARRTSAEKSYELGLPCLVKTKFLADALLKFHSVEARIIPPGIDLAVFHPGEQHSYDGPIRISAMFRPTAPWRGAKRLLDTIEHLRTKLPQAQIRFFGDPGEIPRSFTGFVQSLGPASQHEVADLYRSSDMTLDLSDWQGFGRIGIEAMACGCVPVLTSSGGVETYAINGHNSIMIDSFEPQAIAEQVLTLAQDRDRRLRLRSAGIERAELFSEALAAEAFWRATFLERRSTDQVNAAQPNL